MKKNINKLFCSQDTTIREVLEKFDNASKFNLPSGIGIFVDKQLKLRGVITDGDVRRALLKGANLETMASDYMTKSPIVFSSDLSMSEILERLPHELNSRSRRSEKFLDKVVIINDKKNPIKIIGYHELWEQKVAIHRNISIIGMGYVGLTLALVMADSDFKIVGVDADNKKIQQLQNGNSYVFENGLPELLKENLNKNLRLSSKIPVSDVFIISVGTPVNNLSKGNPTPNMAYLKKACKEVASKLSLGNLVVLRSTVPIGTSRTFVKPILEKISGLVCGIDFYLSFAPERTAEGSAIKELRSLPQIIGGYNHDSVKVTSAIFRDITSTIVTVDSLEEAEMVKLINNSFRDYSFAFSNQVARIASKFNINSHKLIRYSNKGYVRDPLPLPSPGVGGPCLTKDPYIFSFVDKDVSLKYKLFLNGRKVNESMHRFVADHAINAIKFVNKEKNKLSILFCGLAFKGSPETADIRNSSSIEIVRLFKKKNYSLFGYDAVTPKEDVISLGLKYHDIKKGFKGFDLVMFLNNHNSFRNINIYKMVSSMNNNPIIFDGWDLFESKDILSVKPSVYLGLSNFEESINKEKS
tara:strand:- start:470 stop:2218 length:1749 start_codon:yes stop_codon:yes gene_type:complete